MRSIFLTFAAASFVSPALAQEQDGEVWFTVSGSLPIAKDITIDAESIARFSDADGLYETEFGAVVTHKLSDRVTISAGYFRVPGYDHGNITHIDDRPRQQITVQLGKFMGGSWQTRVRTEQRFRNDGDDVGFRVRPQVRYTLPLGGDTRLRLSHESYINLNTTDWGQRGGYERMRNIAAVVTPLTGDVDVEIGYLNQYRFSQRPGRSDTMDHVITFAIGIDF